MKRPFFTIIVVSYNAGDDLIKTLESIKMQTFKDVAIIIKDGGSTDGSLERAAKCLGIDKEPLDNGKNDNSLKNTVEGRRRISAGKINTNGSYDIRYRDGRIRIIRSKDHGIYDAMNMAVDAMRNEKGRSVSDTAPGYVYFLNCGDVFSSNQVLKKVHEKIQLDAKNSGTIVPTIYYGDIYEMKTSQRVSSNPKIDDFACYRNVPSHQACFYDERLVLRYAFDTVWKVRADYEHFLRCFYVEKAETKYMNLLIADYEGGGFSETRENRKVSETERQQIIHLYLTKKQIQRFDTIRALTLAPLRTKIAENPKTAGVYNKIKSLIYRHR
ncbi:glycosyltransferase [Butyrivibrio sp. LC3010]|uniref:glycosyltransferase n=1 Tax=Butyrivibrio sp. LC3010 TaxID=1280680 RepID=UPI00047A96BD|nr:glycosyltransferase [Butyrivibrio sp. LC3010]